jgi:integrase
LHKLRHTAASLLIAKGEDPAYVMRQLGHTDPAFTLRIYTHSMERRDGEVERLRELVEGVTLAGGWSQRRTSPASGMPH